MAPSPLARSWNARAENRRGDFFYHPSHVIVLACVAIVTLTALSLRIYEPQTSHVPIAIGCGAAVMGLIAYLHYVVRLPWISASVVYLVLFWIFHFGLAFTDALIPDALMTMPQELVAFKDRWMYWPNVRLAMLLSLLGAVGFVFGVGVMGRPPASRHAMAPDQPHDPSLYAVGWLLMLAGIGGSMFALVNGGGLGVFALGYAQFRSDVLGPSVLFFAIQLSYFGCVMALCGAGGRRWIGPLSLWTAFACPLMLLGLRNEAMIPLVGFVIVLTHRNVRFSRGLLAVAALISLLVIPAIKTFRAVGFGNRSQVSWTEASPLGTLTEMGGSLRAVKAYVDWIEAGDAYLLGASYWAPVDRHLLVWVIPGRERIPFEEDERVPGRNISVREGHVGTASTGEAYYNFGSIGPFIYFSFVGALFGWLERRAPESRYRSALLGMILFPFYWNIRGQWISVPALVAAAVILVGCTYLLSRFVRGRARPA